MNGVRRIVGAIRLSSRASEKVLGVSAAQLFVLQQLADRAARGEAAPSIAQLASSTATDPSSVSVVVSRLAARGFVARRASKSDGRRAEVTITAEGDALLARAPQPIQARLIEALTGMSPERRRELVAGLDDLVNALGLADQSASMFFEEEGERSEDGKGVGAHENVTSESKPGR
jgi:DNA-binding MarR family transcriptional regulator